MRTSMLVLAAALLVPAAAHAQAVTWQSDYAKARAQAGQQSKPMAIVFGTGANGQTNLVRDGGLTGEIGRVLAEQFIPVYIDTTTPEGKQLAEQFEITTPTGIVITDRTGKLQAFWHQGDLSRAALTGYLNVYSDPARQVRGTDTNPPQGGAYNSNYPPSMTGYGATGYNAFYPGGMGYGGGGGLGAGYGGGCGGGYIGGGCGGGGCGSACSSGGCGGGHSRGGRGHRCR